MKLTFPVYITLDCENAVKGKELLDGMLRSELILKISWGISQPILAAFNNPANCHHLEPPKEKA